VSISVAIDTMTLVWGVAQEGAQTNLQRAEWLFKELDRTKARIIVPSIVAAEYLSVVKDDDKTAVLAALSQRFIIAPFDVKCARLASILWQEGKRGRPKGKPNCRVTLRADTMIIATAKTHGAKEFYSGDGSCRNLAKKAGLTPFDLPTTSEWLIPPDKWGEVS
jgi:predicted nucleic acid-binding protein